MAGRTLHVRCATWEQVDHFTTRKLRKGRLLAMKVPFAAKVGSPVTLGLELPNEMVVAIDGTIQKAAPVEIDGKPDGTRTWIEIDLHGMSDEVRARLDVLLKKRDDEVTDPKIEPVAPMRRTGASSADDLPEDERALFQHLTGELRRLRQGAVHEVLGVARDASPDDVRRAWKDLIRRNHPDLVARRQAPAITHLAEELTILANRAYDRMRAQLVADGRGAVAGPSVAAPAGWLVGFDDLASGDGPAPGRARVERAASPSPEASVPIAAPTVAAGQGSDSYETRARAMLAQGDPATAREVLAAALVVYPRSKPLRSLYYVATALAALQDGEVMLATSQLETALAHHAECTEATRLLDHVKKHGNVDTATMTRVFR